MPCYHPVDGWLSKSPDKGFTFSRSDAFLDRPLKVPCGRCIGCRVTRSREWAIRCVHEASLYDQNCFITLTYDDQHLPYDRSLKIEDFQKFMKRLRQRHKGRMIRFFHSGEYGDNLGRPHYHALIFNYDFPDKYVWRKSGAAGNRLNYRSKELEELWPYGLSEICDMSFTIAAYCARYVLKKRTGPDQQEYYCWQDPKTLKVYDRVPEYSTMSRRPGLGKGWFDKYWEDIFPCDFVVHEGKKFPVPRFYLELYAAATGVSYWSLLTEEEKKKREVIAKRKALARQRDPKEQSKERLAVREKVAEARMSQSKGELRG